jgi:methionyl aminopeptidase
LSARRKTPGRTDEQVLLMRAAGLLVGQTLEVVSAAVADGVTTIDLDRLAEAHIRDHGGRPSFPEVPGYRHTLCTSVNEQVVHGIPGERVLRAGDLLSIDCGAIVAGWHGDAAVTVIVGGPEAARPRTSPSPGPPRTPCMPASRRCRSGKRLYAVGEAVEASIEAPGSGQRT